MRSGLRSRMNKTLKKIVYVLFALVGIAIMTMMTLYFINNTLVNLIGVPLAAYHSYEAWQMEGIPVEELVVPSPEPPPISLGIYLLNFFLFFRLLFVFLLSREIRRFRFKANRLKWIWLIVVFFLGSIGYISYLIFRKFTQIPRTFNPRFQNIE